MNNNDNLTLKLDSELTERLCQQIEKNVAGAAQRVAALVSLQTFIAATSDGSSHSGGSYKSIRTILDRYTEQARTILLNEQTQALIAAITAQDVTAIARIYTPLSRSGFWSVMEQMTEKVEGEELQRSVVWCNNWYQETKARGEAASPYPDAIDFKGAGIDLAEYTAMGDLNNFLQSQSI